MPTTDPFVDEYIEKAQDFAQPVLRHLRELVHKACPDVVEGKKWSMPSFEYKGILCGFAAFKQHCTFGFWKHELLGLGSRKDMGAMGSFGKLTSLKDLPSDKVITKLIHDAMKLNEDGVKIKRSVPKERKELVVPDILKQALKTDARAAETFENFPYSCKKEYIEWITEAKTDATREKRLATTMEWLAEGKRRNWKYEKC